MIKVLYVANECDYGFPSWGVSYEKMNFQGSFEGMPNVELKVFDYFQEKSSTSIEEMSKKLVQECIDFDPDFVFCCFMTLDTDPTFESVSSLTRKGYNTFLWACDDRMRFDAYSKVWIPHFKWLGTMYPPAIEKYNQNGGQGKVILTEYAANNFSFVNQDLSEEEKIYDVSFIGQGAAHSNRRELVNGIRNSGIDLYTFGRGWGGDEKLKTTEEYVDVINKTKINVNFNSCSGIPSLKQINGRFFEIQMCGGFQMAERSTDGLAVQYFTEDEISYYNDVNDLINKINFYLDNPEERKRIAQNGYARALKDHTYSKRFNEIFQRVLGRTE